jgi:TIR domain
MAHDVFLSYRSEDKPAADRLCAGLESNNIICWIAPRNIPVGTEWPAAIVEAIGACKVFVMVLSSHSINAKQISREAELADKNGCQIITFRIEDVEPPPGLNYFLGNIQWIDAFGDQFDTALAKVAQVIKKAPAEGPRAFAPPVPAVTHEPVPSLDGRRADSEEKTPAKSIAWIGPAAVIGALLIGAGTWFALHRSPSEPATVPNSQRPPVPTPEIKPGTPPGAATGDEMSQAKAVADRFLNERETGSLDAAWAELADTFQRRLDKSKWLANQAKLQQHGRVTDKFNGCTPAGNGYFCDYTLAYGDGTAERDKIWLIRGRDGGWKVSRSEMPK